MHGLSFPLRAPLSNQVEIEIAAATMARALLSVGFWKHVSFHPQAFHEDTTLAFESLLQAELESIRKMVRDAHWHASPPEGFFIRRKQRK